MMEMLVGVSCGMGERLRARRGLRCGRALVVAEPGLVDGEIERFGIEPEHRVDLVQVGASEGGLALAVQCLWTVHI